MNAVAGVDLPQIAEVPFQPQIFTRYSLPAIKNLYSLTSVSLRVVHGLLDSIVEMLGVGIAGGKSWGFVEP